MPCGCTATCGCTIVQGNGITVLKAGSKYTISAIPQVSIGVPTFIQQLPPTYADGPYVWHETDGDGNFVTTWIETGN